MKKSGNNRQETPTSAMITILGWIYRPLLEIARRIGLPSTKKVNVTGASASDRDVFRQVVLRKSHDEIGRQSGWRFHRDGLHLNSQSGKLLADLVQSFLIAETGTASSTKEQAPAPDLHKSHEIELDTVSALVPDAEFVMPARDARFLTGDMSLDANEPRDKLRGGWVIRKTQPARLLHEGDRIGSLEVIATPGHTPGHCSFLDVRDRTLIAGDAFQTMGGVAVSGTFKPLFPLVYYATWHKGLALESARKLRSLEPGRMAVGHGRLLKEPLAAMDRAITVLARRLEHQAKKQGTFSRTEREFSGW